jgi:hypothetical protein
MGRLVLVKLGLKYPVRTEMTRGSVSAVVQNVCTVYNEFSRGVRIDR